MSDNAKELAVQRVRHPIKVRQLRVRRLTPVTPLMLKVTFHSPDLADFISGAFDDHIKLFFPADGVAVVPELTPEGIRFPEGTPRPPMRDYTPRQYRPADNELDIEFLLHGDGPAASWAARAQIGDMLVAAGPRGSFIVPDDFDWQWMIGDETALPAIARRLEELPDSYPIHVIALVRDASEEQAFRTRAQARTIWVHRNTADPADADPLLGAVRAQALPSGDGYIWGGGEAAQMRALQQLLTTEKGMDKSRLRISNYWKQGAAGDTVK